MMHWLSSFAFYSNQVCNRKGIASKGFEVLIIWWASIYTFTLFNFPEIFLMISHWLWSLAHFSLLFELRIIKTHSSDACALIFRRKSIWASTKLTHQMHIQEVVFRFCAYSAVWPMSRNRHLCQPQWRSLIYLTFYLEFFHPIFPLKRSMATLGPIWTFTPSVWAAP